MLSVGRPAAARLAAMSLVLVAGLAQAEIYKYVDPVTGAVEYTNQPKKGAVRMSTGDTLSEIPTGNKPNRGAAVKVSTSGSALTFSTPSIVSNTGYASGGIWRSYDISPDGQRFLVMKQDATSAQSAAPGFVVVQNWIEELRKLVPAR